MMNVVNIIGRLTRDVEAKKGSGKDAKSYAKFTLAVDRMGEDNGADFISCTAFGGTADFLDKWGDKGCLLGVNGSLSTGSYEKDGHTVYTTDVLVRDVTMCTWPKKEEEEEEEVPWEKEKKPEPKSRGRRSR